MRMSNFVLHIILPRSAQLACSFSKVCRSLCVYLLTREDLPVLNQLFPDDFPQDLDVDAEQLGDWGVRVVEAVQQNLGFFLLHHGKLDGYKQFRYIYTIGIHS